MYIYCAQDIFRGKAKYEQWEKHIRPMSVKF